MKYFILKKPKYIVKIYTIYYFSLFYYYDCLQTNYIVTVYNIVFFLYILVFFFLSSNLHLTPVFSPSTHFFYAYLSGSGSHPFSLISETSTVNMPTEKQMACTV